MRAYPAILAILLLGLTACQCGKKPPPLSPEGSVASEAGITSIDPSTLDGSKLYASHCAVCHADDATGYKADNAPSLVNPTFLESATDDYLRRSIASGRPGTSMAPYGKEVGGPFDAIVTTRLVTWLREKGPAPVALPNPATGDATRGAPLYAANCASCHGTPDARGKAVHLANARFLEVASDAFIRWAIVQGRPNTTMESWKGKLTDTQIDDVVAYVRAFGTPPPLATLPPPTGKEPLVLNPSGRAPTFTLRADPCSPQPCTEDPRYVSVEQVKKALDAKRRIVIIDARPPSDWMRAHITGAVSIPYYDLKRTEELTNDGTWIVAYCACPHHLSGDVVNALRKRGIKNSVVLDEGILEWHRRGYPVVAAPGVMPPPTEPGRGDAGR